MKRTLVTGGGGFIGSHLCKALLEQSQDVICVDNFFTGSESNVANYLQNSRFELIRHDVVSPLELEVDQIFNLACPASPIHHQTDPIQTIKTSVYGAINVLELAKHTKSQILQASTSEVYGDPDVHPQDESYWGRVNSIGPRACYDESKRCAETLFFNYHREHHLDVKVARIFNTYGPLMPFNDGRVVSNFIVQALQGRPLTVYGDGAQTRSFCFVSDLVGGLMCLMESGPTFIGPVNLGNPQEITVLELAETIRMLTGSKSGIERRPRPQDDPQRRCPDISLAQRELGWSPTTALKEGLSRTIADFDRRMRAAF